MLFRSIDCVKVDAIRRSSNALIHNIFPLPVASIVDDIEMYDASKAQGPWNLYGKADFYFIDAGDDPREALPYTGPSWYWKENAEAIMHFGVAKKGRVLQSHVIAMFKASEHAEPDALAKPYAEIEQIVEAAMQERLHPNSYPLFSDPKPHTEDEIRRQAKFMILAMREGWTGQRHYSWECVNALYEEHCPGPVHMRRHQLNNN